MTVEASAIPVIGTVACGVFGGLRVETTQLGCDRGQALLGAGRADMAWISSIKNAHVVSDGSDAWYVSIAGAQAMENGLVISADTEISISDRKAQRFWIHSVATGTLTPSCVLMRARYAIDHPQATFDTVTALSGRCRR